MLVHIDGPLKPRAKGRRPIIQGIYFGAELVSDDPLVKSGAPMHGANLFPPDMPEFRKAVLDYMAAMTQLGHCLMPGIALSLGLEESYAGHKVTQHRLFWCYRAWPKQNWSPARTGRPSAKSICSSFSVSTCRPFSSSSVATTLACDVDHLTTRRIDQR